MCIYVCVRVCACVCLSEVYPRLRTAEFQYTCFKDEVTKVQREFICLKLSKLMKWRKWS